MRVSAEFLGLHGVGVHHVDIAVPHARRLTERRTPKTFEERFENRRVAHEHEVVLVIAPCRLSYTSGVPAASA